MVNAHIVFYVINKKHQNLMEFHYVCDIVEFSFLILEQDIKLKASLLDLHRGSLV